VARFRNSAEFLRQRATAINKRARGQLNSIRRPGAGTQPNTMTSNRAGSSSPSVELESNSNSATSSADTVDSVPTVDGQATSKSTNAESALPGFLKLARTDIHAKFVDLEWLQRNRLAQGLQPQTADEESPWARLTGDEVARRNRYMNVDPFSNNRIRLKVPEGHSDYINASAITVQSTISGNRKNFIATQGPKEGIYGHVWRMIWHECEDPIVVVMLTQTHESGREKCFQYFPLDMDNPVLPINEEDEFEDSFTSTLTLKSVTEDEATRSTIREMELTTADGDTKTVWHLLFGGWPDFSVPEGVDRAALVRLVALSASKNTAPNSPRVVHCSAGVGRTGTFIALDWLLTELEEGRLDNLSEDEDPIADVVDTLREQRMMMVQGEQQFFFLYDVLRQMWLERYQGSQSRLELDGAADTVSPIEKLRAALEMEMKNNMERI